LKAIDRHYANENSYEDSGGGMSWVKPLLEQKPGNFTPLRFEFSDQTEHAPKELERKRHA